MGIAPFPLQVGFQSLVGGGLKFFSLLWDFIVVNSQFLKDARHNQNIDSRNWLRKLNPLMGGFGHIFNYGGYPALLPAPTKEEPVLLYHACH